MDGLYMEAVLALAGHGGWPMTVFLDPEGRPFFGGTYFPPEPRHGMPSFRQVLLAVSDAFANRRGDLDRQAQVLDAGDPGGRAAGAVLGAAHRVAPRRGGALARALRSTRRTAGSGTRPSSRRPRTLEFLFREGSEEALGMARATLDGMAAGGMYDLVGGGFHRYSVDAFWLVPHFEKMLYDNALLASAYLHSWALTGEERDRRIAEETLDYMVRELRLPDGGFASAQDADTDGVEGTTYTWTEAEIEAVLGEPHADWLLPFEHGRSILRAEIPADGPRGAARGA